MPKITRITHTIFGGGASAAVNGIAQFGSKQAGSPNYSVNIATIQSLAAWLQGWAGAVTAGKVPPLEELNAAFLEPSYQIGYMLEMGIPEYDAGTTYFTSSICQYTGLLYQSITDNNTGNTPSSSPSDWQIFSQGAGKGENLFRNAGMSIYQRGPDGTNAAGTSAYTLDGWIVSATGQSVDWNAAASHLGATALVLSPGSGTPTDCLIKQRIESNFINPISPTTFITVQAAIYNASGASITPKLTVNYPNSVDTYGAVTAYVNAVNLQACPNGQTTVISYTFAMSTKLYNGMEVIFDFGGGIQSSGIEFGSPDISTTPFLQNTGLQSNPPLPQIRPIGIEIENCYRYLQVFGGSNQYEVLGNGAATSTTVFVVQIPLLAKMNGVPALTYDSLGSWQPLNLATQGNAQTSLTALSESIGGSINQSSSQTVMLQGTVSSGLTQGQIISLQSNTTNGRIILSTEL